MNVLRRSVAVAWVGALLWSACGGDSDGDSNDAVAVCKQGCTKIQSLCFPDAGGTTDCDANCAPRDGGGGGGTCTNQDEITAAAKACLDKNTCTDLLTCSAAIPDCQRDPSGAGGSGGSGGTGGGGSGGAGGSSGTGGGGTGGAGGSSGGGTCADLLACCNAATTDQIKSACMTAYNAVMGQGDAACGPVLMSLKASVCP